MTDSLATTTSTKVLLKDCCDEISQRIDNPAESGFERFLGLEHLETGETSIRNWGSTEDVTSSMKLFKAGDMIVARRNVYLRRAARAHFDGVCSGDGIVLRGKSGICLPDLLPFLLNTDSFWDYVTSQADGTMSKRITVKRLLSYEFALPPLEEQRRIVEVLQAVERSRDQNRLLGAKLEAARLTWLDDQTKQFAKDFPELRLEDVCEQITDGAHFTPTYVESGVPFLRVTDIQSEKIDWKNVKRIPMEEHKELCHRCSPSTGDVLLSKNGTIGITKVIDWEEEFSIFVSLCLLKPSSKIEPAYLKSMIEAPHAARQLLLRIKQGTVKNLHLEEIRECRIPLPDTKTQICFVKELEKFSSAQRHLIERNGALNQISASILRQIGESKTA